jgi:hypothetical protein
LDAERAPDQEFLPLEKIARHCVARKSSFEPDDF